MTPINVVLEQIKALGVSIVVDGDKLRVSPTAAVTAAVRDLIAANRPALLAALQPLDLHADPDTVMCTNCTHFIARPSARPDGWCRHYRTETWQNVPFWCAGFEADHTPTAPAHSV